jgi:hypothetical protein
MNAGTLIPSMVRPVCCLGTLLTAVILCGCATPALWKSTAAGHWVPGEPERLCIFTTRSAPSPDVAVFFTQTETTRKTAVTRPALWRLNQSSTNLVVNAVAISSVTNRWRGVRTLPLYRAEATIPTNQTTAPLGYAVLLPAGTGFTLHKDGFPTGPYPLPTSDVKTQTTSRIIGTPFAVGIDAALIATAVCGVAFVDLSTSGSGCH